ncbi:unnamed protein product [Soboliphyme baturini]|uniref:Rubis-subs-bind domain-containing protein n=1 Tax=Soboliphyme baturini TaxID=241478 RepID=A0A183JAH5_9BILA|nr:unnamed protein product [Soboliphyme baturini]
MFVIVSRSAATLDGAFGICYGEPGQAIDMYLLIPEEEELVRLEMVRLKNYGASWKDPSVQCVLRNFYFTKKYFIPYDVTLCRGSDPAEVIRLLQNADEYLDSIRAEGSDEHKMRDDDNYAAAMTDLQRGRLREEDLPVLLSMLRNMKFASGEFDYLPNVQPRLRQPATIEEQSNDYAGGREL